MNIREQFEQEMTAKGWGIQKTSLGDYIHERVALMWMAWQAASKASEQQLAAVVAENAGLKQTESSLVRNIINDLSDTEFQYTRVQTPATDAFLAEVRAQGVEMFVSHMDYPHSPYEFTHGYMDKHAIEFAAQLRQGAAL